ncbi:avidin-like [Pelodiscus sinensis]|uniref:avidin-like n=1 Tax=Pelodiscus sinensis TaxID=13735 RepID=UPI003F6C66BC
MGKTLVALLLALALVTPGAAVTLGTAAPRKCVLSGSWKSSLGCKMIISGLSETGEFSGSYLPATMAPRAGVLLSPLHGVQHDANRQEQPTFGFTVKWRFRESPPDSVTVFVGQCFQGEQGAETLHTAWLLREEVRDSRSDWRATRVGTSIFTRVK